VQRLILLVTDAELERWGDADIVERAAEVEIVMDRFPMPDGEPPASIEVMDRIVERIRAARGGGASVVVACMGGVGRAGTVAACVLADNGVAAADAIQRVRAARHPEAVETPAQERFVATYAAHRQRRD
jgi:protein-tyrosine phosphatase